MKKRFDHIRYAIEEHLKAINENSGEIQALFDYLGKIDVKLDQLSQRLDAMQLASAPRKVVPSLNQKERRVFLLLYTEQMPLSYQEIAERSELPPTAAVEVVNELQLKGIPFRRSVVNSQVFLQMDHAFKELQAKENVINVSLNSFLSE